MELYEINKSLQDFKKRLDELVKAINLPKLDEELNDYEEMMNEPWFWNDQEKYKNILKKVKILKNKKEIYNLNNNLIEELELYYQMHKAKEEDLEEEIVAIISEIELKLN